jgi:hypothetical protein
MSGPLRGTYYYTGTGFANRTPNLYGLPHQGARERKRRLRQIAFGRLPISMLTPEARRAALSMANWL